MLPADTPTEQTPSSPTAELPPLSLSLCHCLSLFLCLSCLLNCLHSLFSHFPPCTMLTLERVAFLRCFSTSANFYMYLPPPSPAPYPCHTTAFISAHNIAYISPPPHHAPFWSVCLSVCKCEICCISCHAQPTCQCNVYAICENYVYAVRANTFLPPHTHTYTEREEPRASIKNAWTSAVVGGKRVLEGRGDRGE